MCVCVCVCVCVWDVLTVSLCLCSRRLRWVVTMAPFLRIAFNAYDVGALPPLTDPPICAIKLKESVSTGMYRCKHTHVCSHNFILTRGEAQWGGRPYILSWIALTATICWAQRSTSNSRCFVLQPSLWLSWEKKSKKQTFCSNDDLNLLSKSEERLWSRGSPPCIQPGSPRLMLTSMRGVS